MNMSNKPKVSVVVTTYNRVNMLRETVGAILAQTWQDFELIIVDNMSTDGTDEFSRSILNPGVRFIQNDNQGIIAVNRNVGIRESQGQYIAFCDDDDIWLPEKLEKQVCLMEAKPEIGLCFGYAENFGDTPFKGQLLYAAKESDSIRDFASLFMGNRIACCTVMVRKSCLDQVGLFDENIEFKALEDYDLWLRLAYHFSISCIPRTLALYRVQSNSASSNKLQERIKLLRLVEKYEKLGWVDAVLVKRSRSQIYWMIGNALLTERKPEYKAWFRKSYYSMPTIRSVFGALLTILPLDLAVKFFQMAEEIKVKFLHAQSSKEGS